jgi:FAD/FMN-containing dehydrogenase
MTADRAQSHTLRTLDKENGIMSIHKTLDRLSDRLSCQVSTPGQVGYADATAIWSKTSRTPRAVVHCRTVEDVQSAVRAARDCDLPCRCAAEATIGQVALCAMASLST